MSRSILTQEQMKVIARRYDGTSETISALMKEFKCPRYIVCSAARRVGVARKKEPNWTAKDERYLKRNWGFKSLQEIARTLGRTELAIILKKRRLGLTTKKRAEEIGFTIRDLEELTKVDHRHWLRFIDQGELKFHRLYVDEKSFVSRVVDTRALNRFLKKRPEFIDYENLSAATRAVLELDKMPPPPRFKEMVCRSKVFEDQTVNQSFGKMKNRKTKVITRRHGLTPCSEKGTRFWAPIYENSVQCPYCGCIVGRFSETRRYRDDDPGDADVIKLLAGKLGLSYRNGRIYKGAKEVSEAELLEYTFHTGRNPRQAMSTFRKLIETGLSPISFKPVDTGNIRNTVLDIKLTPRQQRTWQEFLQLSNIGVYWPPGEGKMFFGAYAMSRIPGHHVVFCNTSTLVEAWCEFFERHATKYGCSIARKWKPAHREITLYENGGKTRCVIEVFTYTSRHDFKDTHYQLALYDEAHFLPGNNAHRLALLDTEFRIATTATKLREDGREDLISLMTGQEFGQDWQEVLSEREHPLPTIDVKVCSNKDSKFQLLDGLIESGRGIIFVESVADGKMLSNELGLPYIYSETKNRMDTIRQHRAVIMGRVGDYGLDITDLKFVVEYGFFKGSRSQQLQRYGRLLHSGNANARHTVLMTRREFSRHWKRLEAFEKKGLRFSIHAINDEGYRSSEMTMKLVSNL